MGNTIKIGHISKPSDSGLAVTINAKGLVCTTANSNGNSVEITFHQFTPDNMRALANELIINAARWDAEFTKQS